jgi:alpha-L-fucosidase
LRRISLPGHPSNDGWKARVKSFDGCSGVFYFGREMRAIITLSFICFLLPDSAAWAGDPLNVEGDFPMKKEYQERQERVSQWYAPARFGLFCHWGLFTGGGDSSTDDPHPFCYNTVAELEAAAGDPGLMAGNLVATAKRMGARYLTFTLLHSCDRYAVMFPAKTPGFKMKTTKDYIGALAARCRQENVRLLLYLCGGSEHGFSQGGPWLEEPLRDPKKYVEATKGLLDELAALHPGEISGFWIDGNPSDLPKYMREHFPGCIVIHNNDGNFGWGSAGDPNIDYGTTEFLSGPASPEYSRPSGLVKTHAQYGMLPPRRDYNEDIPCVGSWWYQSGGPNGDGYRGSPYAKNPTLIVKQMVSSLGQRREWNFAVGVGPMVDGKFSPSLAAMVENLHNFFAWASESIYDTIGGEGAALIPGWWNSGAYGSVTVSLKDPKILYVHVTTEPKSDTLRVPNNGYKVASVADLRTGRAIQFIDIGVLIIKNQDWSDVRAFGDKVFKIVLAGTP